MWTRTLDERNPLTFAQARRLCESCGVRLNREGVGYELYAVSAEGEQIGDRSEYAATLADVVPIAYRLSYKQATEEKDLC